MIAWNRQLSQEQKFDLFHFLDYYFKIKVDLTEWTYETGLLFFCYSYKFLTITAPRSADTQQDTWPDFLQHWAFTTVTEITGGSRHAITHKQIIMVWLLKTKSYGTEF